MPPRLLSSFVCRDHALKCCVPPSTAMASPASDAVASPLDDAPMLSELMADLENETSVTAFEPLQAFRLAVTKQWPSIECFVQHIRSKPTCNRTGGLDATAWNEVCNDLGLQYQQQTLFHLIQRDDGIVRPMDIRVAAARVAPDKSLSEIRTIFLMLSRGSCRRTYVPLAQEIGHHDAVEGICKRVLKMDRGALDNEAFQELCAFFDIRPDDAAEVFRALKRCSDVWEALRHGTFGSESECTQTEATVRLSMEGWRPPSEGGETGLSAFERDPTPERLEQLLSSRGNPRFDAADLLSRWKGASPPHPMVSKYFAGPNEQHADAAVRRRPASAGLVRLARPVREPGRQQANLPPLRHAMATAGDLVLLDKDHYREGETVWVQYSLDSAYWASSTYADPSGPTTRLHSGKSALPLNRSALGDTPFIAMVPITAAWSSGGGGGFRHFQKTETLPCTVGDASHCKIDASQRNGVVGITAPHGAPGAYIVSLYRLTMDRERLMTVAFKDPIGAPAICHVGPRTQRDAPVVPDRRPAVRNVYAVPKRHTGTQTDAQTRSEAHDSSTEPDVQASEAEACTQTSILDISDISAGPDVHEDRCTQTESPRADASTPPKNARDVACGQDAETPPANDCTQTETPMTQEIAIGPDIATPDMATPPADDGTQTEDMETQDGSTGSDTKATAATSCTQTDTANTQDVCTGPDSDTDGIQVDRCIQTETPRADDLTLPRKARDVACGQDAQTPPADTFTQTAPPITQEIAIGPDIPTAEMATPPFDDGTQTEPLETQENSCTQTDDPKTKDVCTGPDIDTGGPQTDHPTKAVQTDTPPTKTSGVQSEDPALHLLPCLTSLHPSWPLLIFLLLCCSLLAARPQHTTHSSAPDPDLRTPTMTVLAIRKELETTAIPTSTHLAARASGTVTSTSEIPEAASSTPSTTTTRTVTSTFTCTATCHRVPATAGTFTSTSTATLTATSTSTATLTSTATDTCTPSCSLSHTHGATAIPTPTQSVTPTVTATPAPTFTPSPTSTALPAQNLTSTITATRTPVLTPSSTPTPLGSCTDTTTATVTPTPTWTPSATSTTVPTHSPTSTATATPAPTLTPSPTSTTLPSQTPTWTATATPAPTSTPTRSATRTPAPTTTPLPTPTRIPLDSATSTRTATPAATARENWRVPTDDSVPGHQVISPHPPPFCTPLSPPLGGERE